MYNDRLVPIRLLANIRYNTTSNDRDLNVHLGSNDPDVLQQLEQNIKQRAEDNNKHLAQYKQKDLTVDEEQLLQGFQAALQEYPER